MQTDGWVGHLLSLPRIRSLGLRFCSFGDSQSRVKTSTYWTWSSEPTCGNVGSPICGVIQRGPDIPQSSFTIPVTRQTCYSR